MELLYKPDWEQTQQNYIAWWNREDFGRCALSVTAPKAGSEKRTPPPFPEQVADRWKDHEYLRQKNEYIMQTTYYGAEAFPMWNPGYVWEKVPAYMGMKIHLDENTGWREPMISKGSLTDYDFRKFTVDFDSEVWKESAALHQFAVDESKGKCLSYIGGIGHNGDLLASMRDPMQLLYDLTECPEYVKEFELHMIEEWKKVFDALFEITSKGSFGGCCPWMRVWAPGRLYIPANDFSYMISTDMYRDVYYEALGRHLEMLDYSIYHVDGISAFRHVDMLCEFSRLNGLQILPGAGKPSPLRYMDVLKKVQAHGKNLHITIPAKEVPEALENLSSKGLYIETSCESEEEAKALIKYCEKNSKFY